VDIKVEEYYWISKMKKAKQFVREKGCSVVTVYWRVERIKLGIPFNGLYVTRF